MQIKVMLDITSISAYNFAWLTPSLKPPASAGVRRKEAVVAESARETRKRVAEQVEKERAELDKAAKAQRAKGKKGR